MSFEKIEAKIKLMYYKVDMPWPNGMTEALKMAYQQGRIDANLKALESFNKTEAT